MHRAYNSLFKTEVTTIFPGEVFVSREGHLMATVLGSCIAVCLGDPIRRVFGMNHFMLPAGRTLPGTPTGDPKLFYSEDLRYGTTAMELLIGDLQKAGAERKHMRAKIFGGAHVLQARGIDIGRKNIDFIRSYLTHEGIPLDSEDVGGDFGRKIFYLSAENRVLRKKIQHADTLLVARDEERFAEKVEATPRSGSVDLF